jgi:hypothetical protein
LACGNTWSGEDTDRGKEKVASPYELSKRSRVAKQQQ